MKVCFWMRVLVPALFCLVPLQARVVFQTTSPYHHIRVVDQGGIRTLSFDGSMETRMSLVNHLLGHFEYTEYFHMPWLWNTNMTNVLMIGLGGGSAQRSYQHYYPDVMVDTVEIDPVVVDVAKKFFNVRETHTFRIHVGDGRLFLRRQTQTWDSIMVDAYTTSRYGSSIPQHLATKEFFQMVSDRLPEDGVLVYNVMGRLAGAGATLPGALYRTMREVFPHVYVFPARESVNVVLLASKSEEPMTPALLRTRAAELIRSKRVTLPTFPLRVQSFTATPPATAARSPVLTDDFAPLQGLLKTGSGG
jgi:spermidine synthase